MIYKRCSNCGKRLKSGEKCSCWERRRQKHYDTRERNKKAANFYNSPPWKKLRAAVMQKHGGLDLFLYATTGEVAAADTVHHIIPLMDDWDRRLDASNLIPLASATHNEIHRLYETEKTKTQKKLFEILETQGAG